jgi:hypothetical protein
MLNAFTAATRLTKPLCCRFLVSHGRPLRLFCGVGALLKASPCCNSCAESGKGSFERTAESMAVDQFGNAATIHAALALR